MHPINGKDIYGLKIPLTCFHWEGAFGDGNSEKSQKICSLGVASKEFLNIGEKTFNST